MPSFAAKGHITLTSIIWFQMYTYSIKLTSNNTNTQSIVTSWKLTFYHPLTDRRALANRRPLQKRLLGQAGGLSKYYCNVNEDRAGAVSENNVQAPWVCAV